MGEQDRRADLVEQRHQRIAVELLLLGKAHDRWKLRGVELIEHGIARLAGSRPLRVEMRLRPLLVALGRDEALLDEIDARGLHRPVDLRPVRGASARHLVDHIDGIAPAHEILRPALAAVGRAGEVGAGLAAAVHHHDRIGMAATRRDHVLDVHMPDRGAAFGRAVDLAADEEVARARERERPALLRPGERRRSSTADIIIAGAMALLRNPSMHSSVMFLFVAVDALAFDCRGGQGRAQSCRHVRGRRAPCPLAPLKERRVGTLRSARPVVSFRPHASGSKAKPVPLRTMAPKPGKSR